MTERALQVPAYEMSDDKRRARIARLMESLGERVQGSVFEAYLGADELETIYKRSKKVMNEKEDSLRVYALCQSCRAKVVVKGEGRVTPPPGTIIL